MSKNVPELKLSHPENAAFLDFLSGAFDDDDQTPPATALPENGTETAAEGATVAATLVVD